MNWNIETLEKFELNKIANLESKQKIADKIVDKVKDGQVIGFGSGSTSYLATIAIANKIRKENIHILAVPTSIEIKMLCANLGIATTSLFANKPDWSFDGADEVDKSNWLIKGRGGAMFKEKLNIANSKITYILIDNSKKVEKLCTKHKIPVECCIDSVNYVKERLQELGGIDIALRKAEGKDGPIITENGNLILDVKFENITNNLEKEIKSITGVVESGLFIGYNVEIIS